jgi:hypothetical protein
VSKKAFDFEFDDQSAAATGKKHDALSYEVSEEAQLTAELLNGSLFLWGNRPGLLGLAKILIRMGLSEYKDGFHVHLRQDFSGDAELPDVLTICVNSK